MIYFNIIELRSLLQKALSNSIGRYTFPQGTTSEALAVLPDPDSGYDYPPPGTKAEGLEVVIHRPYPEPLPIMGGVGQKWTTKIILKQWDSDKNLVQETEILTIALEKYNVVRIVAQPPNGSLGTIEQVKFEIVDYSASTVSIS